MTLGAARWWTKSDSELGLARLAFDNGYHDNTVTLAYYTVFYAMRACLAQAGHDPERSSHGHVAGEFSRLFVKTGEIPRETARDVGWLAENRSSASYDADSGYDAIDARGALDRALRFRALTEPIRARCVDWGG